MLLTRTKSIATMPQASFIFAAAAMLLTGASSQAALIYADSFSGAAGEGTLHASVVESSTGSLGGTLGAVWKAGNFFGADGQVVTVTGVQSRSVAFLPFTPQLGLVYELSASVDTISAAGFMGIGFANDTGFVGGTNESNNNMRMITAPTANLGMMFVNAVNNTYATYFNGNNVLSSLALPMGALGSDPWNLKIVLDTTAADWELTYFLDGSLIQTHSLAPVAINSVGLNLGNPAGGSTYDNFLLQTVEVVPEPASAVLSGVALVGVMLMRRRQS